MRFFKQIMTTAISISSPKFAYLIFLVGLSAECGLHDGVLFCVDRSICSKYCDRRCELITSSELRNVNYFADKRIQAIPGKISANDHFFNYFDIEMSGLRPGICGAYSMQKLPQFLVVNRKSILEQAFTKLQIEPDRTLYAHSRCEHRCSFGCEEVGYNNDVIRALKRSSIQFRINLHECKSVPAWLVYLTVSSVYALLIVVGLLIYKFCIPEEGDALRIIKNEYNARRQSDRRTSKSVASSASGDTSNTPCNTPPRNLSSIEYESN